MTLQHIISIATPRLFFALGLATSVSFGAVAQQLKENVAVDARYKAEYIRQDRINTLPRRLSISMPSSPLQYAEKGVAADFAPVLYALPASGWQASRPVYDNRGYIDVGAGSWLNATLSAGYRFIDTDHSSLGVRLQHNSTSLYKPEIFNKQKADVARKRYEDVIGVYGSHSVNGAGRLDASLQYHLAYFNYFSSAPILPESSNPVSPSQTLNDVRFSAAWTPEKGNSQLDWRAGVSLRYFGYRAYYSPASNDSYLSEDPTRETHLSLTGGVKMPWSSGSAIGLDADIDILFYAKQNGAKSLDNYGNVKLTPYYRFSKGLLNISLGAQIDLTARAGFEGERYSFFHVAPAVRLDYRKGAAGVYLHLLGGTQLNTLASLYQLDNYGSPRLESTRPVYTPLDATLGLNLGPFNGFRGGVALSFKSSNNIALQGWYMSQLRPAPSTLETIPGDTRFDCMNVRGFSIMGTASYSYGNVASVTLTGYYQPQNGTKGYFNGLDRPRWIGDVDLSVRPMKPLKVSLSASYRGVRTLYRNVPLQIHPVFTYELQGVRLPDFATLNIGADYAFSPSFNVWLQANNLLNRHNTIFPCNTTEGINFLVGLGVTF